jgi:hypothetical protein
MVHATDRTHKDDACRALAGDSRRFSPFSRASFCASTHCSSPAGRRPGLPTLLRHLRALLCATSSLTRAHSALQRCAPPTQRAVIVVSATNGGGPRSAATARDAPGSTKATDNRPQRGRSAGQDVRHRQEGAAGGSAQRGEAGGGQVRCIFSCAAPQHEHATHASAMCVAVCDGARPPR